MSARNRPPKTSRRKKDQSASKPAFAKIGCAPAWIAEMQEHFLVEGFYRAEDLERILGDPRDSADTQVSVEQSYACVTRE
jgi:hypothetical protein